MKYFTSDLIKRLNSSDNEVVDAADVEWDRTLKRYQNSIEKIRHLLPKDLVPLDLHDSELELFLLKRHTVDQCLSLELSLKYKSQLFILFYQDVIRLALDVNYVGPALRPTITASDFGSWLVDEISLVNRNTFRHEILFDTGNSLSCEFKDFSLMVKKSGPVP